MTGFNIREQNYESILFGFFPKKSKTYIYSELKDNNKKSGFTVDILVYLCHLNYTQDRKTKLF